jgi:aryl-alcohol dehydrogenase-like predicted oxidoreductase
MNSATEIKRRPLGKTGVEVTILGLGGEGVLRTYGREKDAYRLINSALDLGINYCESARAYSGSESYYGKALKERRKEIFLASKSHGRDKKTALAHLDQTLSNMKTDYLDLWQVHDVRTTRDIEEIFGTGGAIEAFALAKERGSARFIGVTGHEDPAVIRRCIELFDFDTVLLPVNPAEPVYRSFPDEIIPIAEERQMGVIGMKVYFRGLAAQLPFFRSMQSFFDFAVSQPVTTVVIGCDDLEQLKENVDFAKSFTPMPDPEKKELIDAAAPFSRQLMMYKF